VTTSPGDYVLTLRPLAGPVPVRLRLRRALKCLLRAFGLRCVAIREVRSSAPPVEERG
jgi:hypothetical protein